MATALAFERDLLDPASIAPSAANQTALGASVALRPWNRRRDRSVVAGWPAPSHPLTGVWRLTEPSEGPRVSWAIDQVDDQQVIGRITLRDIQPASARLGIYLAEFATGRGYGSEALWLFLPLCFGQLGFEFIQIDVASSNERALRTFRGLGFREVYSSWREVHDPTAVAAVVSHEFEHLQSHFKWSNGVLSARFLDMVLGAHQWPE